MQRYMFSLVGLIAATFLPVTGQALSLSNEPLFLTGSVQPLVMLNISKDHQLSYKAYNDYSDLDGDGTAETTYKDSIDYYGYFDSQKCYAYSTTDNRFNPVALAGGTNSHYCSGQWSGNFLNWATMTRMDAVRKLLYGGKRYIDTATETVLERQFLPTDAHAFAKYYNGPDIASLTPFSVSTTAPTASSSTSRSIGSGSKNFDSSLSVSVGDQIRITDNNNKNNWMIGGVTGKSGSTITIEIPSGSFGGSGTYSGWTLENLSQTGISLCNLTQGSSSGSNQYSQTNTNPPIIRVAKGNFALWGANEKWQCYWSGEKNNLQSGFSGFRSNGNKAYLSGLDASGENPSQTTHGLGSGSAAGEYRVRVKVCEASLIHKEKCQAYGTSYKPIGLLQVYGDKDQLYFGLMTGTFSKNISGGVLRKGVGSFTSEVNSSDGTFTQANGIVTNLDRIRLYGYDYNDGTYRGNDSCNYQQTGFVHSGGSNAQGHPANEGNCSSWGNPMSEIYLESLRYLAGTKTPNPDFAAGTKDAALGLTVVSPWDDPISQNNYCAPLNVLNFNASVSSYDDDQLAGLSDLGTTTSAEDLTKLVGDLELITGKDWFVGNVSGGSTNDLCSSKTIPNFGRIYGVCPEAPAQQGTYLMSGIAYYAHTNRIRSDLKVPTGKEYADALKVTTYGIALATNVPKIEVKVNGKTVTILPAYRLDSSSVGNGPFGGGTLVDFKIVEQTPTHGKFYVNWEDSEMGGDYDQDMWGVIEYAVSGNNITITTDAVSASTGNGQGFGYIISGTDKDGPHFHSGIYDFDYIDPISGVIGCSNCKVGDAPTSVTYAVTGNSGGALNDPLWYAAKYGGFSDSDDDGTPNQVQEWDAVKNATGDPGQDSVPDNFFHVTNPLALERALNSAFLKILRDSSASAVATNSSSLNTGSRVYQGRFSNTAWSGQILSYRLDETTGQLIDTQVLPSPNWDASEKPYPEWDAGYLLNSQTSRLILTSADTGSGWVGAEFDYGNLGATQKGFLDRDMYVYLDSCGPERVAYLRGDRSSEGTGTFTCASSSVIQRFRERNVSILGDVINSNPIYVGPPNAGYAEAVHPGYTAFRQGFGARKPVLYVGANDGMLHGFDVSVDAANNVPTSTSGREVLAYVPSMVYGNLSRLTDRDYSANGNHRYFVDSSPMVADVCTSNCNASSAVWKTLLVGGLGAGGKGYYALNVTNPDVSSKDAAATPMFSSIQAANIVQWEFRADATGDAMGLGYTFNSAPTRSNNGQAKQMAKFENGRWGIVVGNGYNSAQGKAILYVLFVQGPTGTGGVWQAGGVDYVRIEADAGPDNGLSTPVPFDSDGDGKADTVYAGDLKGNLWKFDLSDPSASNWNATKVSLLFKATDASNNPQPIVSVPEVTLHPAGGRMVLFGTGKFLEQGDTTSTSVQSFYGIHDLGATVTGRGNLVPQVIDAVNRTVVQGCGTSPLPSCPTTVEGWYADLPESGERLTGSPQLLAGSIFFNTFIPSITPCEFGGTGYLMGLDYVTGAMLVPSIFDTNQDGKIDGNDTSAGGIKVGAALGGTTLIRGTVNSSAGTGGTASSTVGVGVSSTTDGSTSSDLIDFGAGSRGRISWREIVQ